jgi:two-component system, NtrC family, sensor kinase
MLTPEQRIDELEKKLAAKEKTISILMSRVEGRINQFGSTLSLMYQNLALEDLVNKKTNEIESRQKQLEDALVELKKAQSELIQAQKLMAIGQLAAGIAHEINTPMQYIGDNVAFIQRAFYRVLTIVGELNRIITNRPEISVAEVLPLFHGIRRKNKVDYLLEEIPKAIEQSVEGIKRVSTIVMAMKEFSHPSEGQKHSINLQDAIESTITVARNVWKYVADVETNYDPDLPAVPCLRDEFNQVILNLIVNAADAISDVVDGGSKGKGLIVVRTYHDDDSAYVSIKDSGTGIPESARSKVFDPFFTTKDVGKGTGQGLAIAYSVIVEKHKGQIWFDSELGKGTEFHIKLPLRLQEVSSEDFVCR